MPIPALICGIGVIAVQIRRESRDYVDIKQKSTRVQVAIARRHPALRSLSSIGKTEQEVGEERAPVVQTPPALLSSCLVHHSARSLRMRQSSIGALAVS